MGPYNFAHPPTMNESFTTSPAFGVVSLLDFRLSNRCIVVPHCFNLRSQWYLMLSTLFHMLICHLYNFFGKLYIQNFCPFLAGLLCFLILSFEGSFYILNNSLLSDVSLTTIFSRFIVYLFILLTMSCAEQEFLIVMKSNLPLFSFMDPSFDIVLKKSTPNPRFLGFLLHYLPDS